MIYDANGLSLRLLRKEKNRRLSNCFRAYWDQYNETAKGDDWGAPYEFGMEWQLSHYLTYFAFFAILPGDW